MATRRRITQAGDLRITQDGGIRILEGAAVVVPVVRPQRGGTVKHRVRKAIQTIKVGWDGRRIEDVFEEMLEQPVDEPVAIFEDEDDELMLLC